MNNQWICSSHTRIPSGIGIEYKIGYLNLLFNPMCALWLYAASRAGLTINVNKRTGSIFSLISGLTCLYIFIWYECYPLSIFPLKPQLFLSFKVIYIRPSDPLSDKKFFSTKNVYYESSEMKEWEQGERERYSYCIIHLKLGKMYKI